MTDESPDFDYDYFISRCGAAGEAAVEVAGVLEDAGYRIKVQDRDFGRGSDFVGDIHDALVSARHMYVLHTRDYDQHYWTRKEFTNFLAAIADSPGMRRICVLRCDDAAPRGILANVVYGDLVGVVDPERRRAIILDVARGEALKARREATILGGAMPKRNEHFTGRNDTLARIKALLAADESPTALRVVAIGGLGGVGKTAIVRAYVEQCAPEYVGVWWAAADTRTALVAGLAALAARLDARYEGEADLEKAAKAALARIERVPRPFLLVYDNVKKWSAIDDLVPARGAHLLITSRRSDWGGRAHEVDVDVMTEGEAIDFLQARARRRDEAGARELAKALGCLPLALDHAGAYVKLAMTTFTAYVKSVDRLIAKAPKDAPYPASVAATFSLAIESAISECAAAETLLGHFCHFAPDRIPLDLIGDDILGEEERAEAMIALADVSLLRRDPFDDDTPAVSLHRLVQAAARARLAMTGTARPMMESAVTQLAAAFPDAGYEETTHWHRCDQILPHALAIRDLAAVDGFMSDQLASLYDRVGQFLHGRASFELAQSLFREAITVGRAALGNEHPRIAKTMTNLANVLRDSGRAAQAAPLLRDALRIEENTVGRHDPSYGRTLTSLAAALRDMNCATEAEQLLREAIEVGEAALGRDHPDLAGRYNNLALMLEAQGRTGEAERLLREAIAHGERRLGRGHRAVAVRLNNLAMLLLREGTYLAEAEALFREAIAAGETTLGPDHPEVAVRLNNLANLLRDGGRGEEAEPLYRRAMAAFEVSHGERHVMTARVRRNFAALLLVAGDVKETRRQAQMALAVHAELLDRAHPWTKDSAETLAKALDALGAAAEASTIRTTYQVASQRPD
jgi:tetratricopeptide (TPR) repeat protein